MVLTTLPVKTLSPHQVRPNSTCSIELQRGPHNASIVAHVVCACFFYYIVVLGCIKFPVKHYVMFFLTNNPTLLLSSTPS